MTILWVWCQTKSTQQGRVHIIFQFHRRAERRKSQNVETLSREMLRVGANPVWDITISSVWCEKSAHLSSSNRVVSDYSLLFIDGNAKEQKSLGSLYSKENRSQPCVRQFCRCNGKSNYSLIFMMVWKKKKKLSDFLDLANGIWDIAYSFGWWNEKTITTTNYCPQLTECCGTTLPVRRDEQRPSYSPKRECREHISNPPITINKSTFHTKVPKSAWCWNNSIPLIKK